MIRRPPRSPLFPYPTLFRSSRDNPDGDAHVEGGIRKREVDRADFAERKVVDDLELMDRIGHDRNGSLRFFITPPAQYAVGCYDLLSGGTPPSLPSPVGGGGATPAARTTLITPATKPSNRNTIRPHGEIPSTRSSAQPTPAPSSTPPTSSLESRNPRAYPDASAAGGPRPVSDGSSGRCWPSRSPRRRSLAERAASSVRRFSKSLLSRALSAILTPPARR